MVKNNKVIQEHHLQYQDKRLVTEKVGKTVLLYKGEHWCISQMQRRKNISQGFIEALEFWIEENKPKAIKLVKNNNI